MLSMKVTIAAVAALVGLAGAADAATVTYGFNATLQGGPLAGDSFPGTISFDDSGSAMPGTDYISLTSIDFTLLGRRFSRSDIFAGGQAVTINGALSYFTAAFELLTQPVPLTTVVFGFGGPGVIGYRTSLPNGDGGGFYTLSGPVGVPEPASLSLLVVVPALLRVFSRPPGLRSRAASAAGGRAADRRSRPAG